MFTELSPPQATMLLASLGACALYLLGRALLGRWLAARGAGAALRWGLHLALGAVVLAGLWAVLPWEAGRGWKPMSRELVETHKVGLAAAAAALVGLYWAWHRWLEPRGGRWAGRARAGLNTLLALLALSSFLNYSRLHPTYVWVERVDTYDLCHYYLNARYFEELSYFNLYPAIVLADLEEGPHYKNPPIFQSQDENDYFMVEYAAFVRDRAEHDRIRGLFTPERWQSFKHDFTVLQRELVGFSQKTWYQMLVDHGFNGSPAWVLWAQPLASRVPVEYVKLLGYVDALWLLAALGATAWAYGWRSAGLLTVFLFTTYSTRWPNFTWAFGRYDYVSALIIGLALVRKGRPVLGGAAVGIAAAFRIFPAVWMYGPGFKGVFELLARRRFNRRLLALAVGFFGVLVLLYAGVAARYGLDPAERHLVKLSAHTTEKNLSSMRQGFAIAVAYQGETDIKRMDDARRLRVQRQKRWRTPLAVGLVLLLGWGLRRARDDEALAMGFIPFFLMATASYYYYVVRGTMVALHGGELGRLRNAVGLMLLFGIEVVLNALQTADETEAYRVVHMGWMGRLCALYALVMTAWFLWEGRQAALAERAAAAGALPPGPDGHSPTGALV